MNFAKETHLNEDQLLRALVDMTDLPLFLQKHLTSCPDCRQAKERFELELSQLGDMARRFTPLPKTTVTLPEEPPRRIFEWSWKRRLSFGMALTVLLVVFVLWGTNLMLFAPGENGDMTILKIQDAEALISEVNMLVGNALPQVYLEICAESELDFDETFDEAFFELLILDMDDNSVSLKPVKKGERLC